MGDRMQPFCLMWVYNQWAGGVGGLANHFTSGLQVLYPVRSEGRVWMAFKALSSTNMLQFFIHINYEYS